MRTNAPASRTRMCSAAIALVSLLIAGCAQQPKPLYHWEGYQRQVYEYLKADGSSPAEQLQMLQEQSEKARLTGSPLPPGFRAHVGLLQLKLGRPDEARRMFHEEKSVFPESAQYMDFLLKGMEKKKS